MQRDSEIISHLFVMKNLSQNNPEFLIENLSQEERNRLQAVLKRDKKLRETDKLRVAQTTNYARRKPKVELN